MLADVLEAYDILDDPIINGKVIVDRLRVFGAHKVELKRISDTRGSTDAIKVLIEGRNGKSSSGKAPTLGIVGTLAGIGARPSVKGIVSDADGCITALACAFKLLRMERKGEKLEGDLIITTHICPNAPTEEHEPVPFVRYPVCMNHLMLALVDGSADAILSIDTTKGNRIINWRGFAISPTVKEGYILKVSEDLLELMQITSGRMPVVLPISLQDITPYENGLYHLNTILQPSTVTVAPVVGVAITTEVGVPGCATGASHVTDLEMASRFVIETAKAFTEGRCQFYDKEEYQIITKRYGSMTHFQTR